MVDDAKLLEAWRAGDRAAGEALFERYFDVVRRFFHARLGHDVDDMVQQTFEACVQGRDRVRDGSSFRAYLFGVAYNVMRVDRRQRRRRALVAEQGAGPAVSVAPGPSTWMRAREDAERLRDGLAQLPISLRMVLELHYFEGLSALDIARIVVLPEGTVRSRLRRGRRLLRIAMGQSPDMVLESGERDAVDAEGIDPSAFEPAMAEQESAEHEIVKPEAVEPDPQDDFEREAKRGAKQDAVEQEAKREAKQDAVEQEAKRGAKQDAVEQDAVEQDADEQEAKQDAVEPKAKQDAVEQGAVEREAIEHEAIEHEAIDRDAAEPDRDSLVPIGSRSDSETT